MKRKLLLAAAGLILLAIVVFSLGRGARRRPEGDTTRAPEREHSTMTVVAELPKSNAPPATPAAPEVKFQ